MKKNYLIYIGIFLIILGSVMMYFTLKHKEESKLTKITIDINLISNEPVLQMTMKPYPEKQALRVHNLEDVLYHF